MEKPVSLVNSSRIRIEYYPLTDCYSIAINVIEPFVIASEDIADLSLIVRILKEHKLELKSVRRSVTGNMPDSESGDSRFES